MSSRQPKFGSSDMNTFWYWITERHDIYVRRSLGYGKPWTQDQILQRYKFTNAFRQLDKGTVALTKMCAAHPKAKPNSILFNVWWYRLFNLHDHAENLGFVTNFEHLRDYIEELHWNGKRIFTSAHMTTGVAGERKYISYLRAAEDAYAHATDVCKIWDAGTMRGTFDNLMRYYMIGKFVAYEIVCDMRFLVPPEPVSHNDWANLGPGARRGLIRLGLLHPTEVRGAKMRDAGVREMRHLLNLAPRSLPKRTLECAEGGAPFELREIEHSLCEFDKYERVRLGEGRPRQKYNGGLEV